MTPRADFSICYICNDKRRTADTDASVTPTGPQADSETLKQTLIRAISHGHVEDAANEGDESRLISGVCVLSLSLTYDGELEAVTDRVAGDEVIICRRCTCLLKDFEHHEQMAARKAEEIRKFLMRQLEVKEEDTGKPHVLDPQDSIKKTLARNHDERQGIIAAFRAFKKAGVKDIKGKGRKRKKESGSEDNEEKDVDEEDVDITEEIIVEENVEEEEEEEEEAREQQVVATARQSERIQRRREDGLVMCWGDALCEKEEDMKPLDDEDDLFDYSPGDVQKDRSYTRRGRGRKLSRIVKPAVLPAKEDETGFKFQCPFCFRYYTPMSSRIHNCTSYRNQLRCQACNIFFTSYVRLEKHLETIHIKQKQLACPIDDCSFSCIAEPTLTVHKHFHVLESFSKMESKEARRMRIAEFDQEMRKALQGTVRHEKDEDVKVEYDELGVGSSPEIADRVSFLIDEKNFLSDGHPLNITTDRFSKDADCRILRFQGDNNQENSTSPNRRLEGSIVSPEKSLRKSPKGHNLVLHCPICDLTLVSTRSYQEHIRDVHNLRVVTKLTGESSLLREAQKGQGSESLMRIVKYYNVKKNSNVTTKVLD